jgi:hypothetical protein
MSRDNERIIFLFNEADIADRELLKQLINAGASARTLGMVTERMRISEDAINYLGEDEHRLYNTPPIGMAAVASRPNRINIPIATQIEEQAMMEKMEEIKRICGDGELD